MTNASPNHTMHQLANNQIGLADWSRTSAGAAQWANDMSSMLGDMFDYMTEDDMPADHAADLMFEMVRKVVDAKSVTKYGEPETTPATPLCLVSRQR